MCWIPTPTLDYTQIYFQSFPVVSSPATLESVSGNNCFLDGAHVDTIESRWSRTNACVWKLHGGDFKNGKEKSFSTHRRPFLTFLFVIKMHKQWPLCPRSHGQSWFWVVKADFILAPPTTNHWHPLSHPMSRPVLLQRGNPPLLCNLVVCFG